MDENHLSLKYIVLFCVTVIMYQIFQIKEQTSPLLPKLVSHQQKIETLEASNKNFRQELIQMNEKWTTMNGAVHKRLQDEITSVRKMLADNELRLAANENIVHSLLEKTATDLN